MKVRIPFTKSITYFLRIRRLARYVRGWQLSRFRRLLFYSGLEDWRKYYRAPFPLKGKTVLDVGAGEGETALYFLGCGAKKVIAIEPDKACLPNLYANAKTRPIQVVPEPFSLRHLEIVHDFAKVDIEGWEEILLSADPRALKPMVVEVHAMFLARKFLKRGWRYAKEPDYWNSMSYMTNFALNGSRTRQSAELHAWAL